MKKQIACYDIIVKALFTLTCKFKKILQVITLIKKLFKLFGSPLKK